MSKHRDIIIEKVIQKFKNRSDVGFKKYGVTLKDDDQPLDVWLTHIQEELMDAVNYIEKVKDVLHYDEKINDEKIDAINKANAEYYPEFYKPE
jgi:cob(I)alamin adenosyltransferase